jgi:hypothetical protein
MTRLLALAVFSLVLGGCAAVNLNNPSKPNSETRTVKMVIPTHEMKAGVPRLIEVTARGGAE